MILYRHWHGLIGLALAVWYAPVVGAQSPVPAAAKPADQPVIAATEANVAYGDHQRQVLDFYRAESAGPTPLLFYIHGGGWVRGDKADPPALQSYLKAGISVVSINYRFTWQAQLAGVQPPVKWPLEDAVRALQWVRSRAAQWNLNPERIAASGGSAGACSSLYLALHDDLRQPQSPDPIARQSTRLWCAAVDGAQTSLDPAQLKAWTPNSRYGGHAFGFMDPQDLKTRDTRFAQFLQEREKVLPWIRAYSPIEWVSSDDPPLFLRYPDQPAMGQEQGDPTHTVNYGVGFAEVCAAKGVRCELLYPKGPKVSAASIAEFLIQELKRP